MNVGGGEGVKMFNFGMYHPPNPPPPPPHIINDRSLTLVGRECIDNFILKARKYRVNTIFDIWISCCHNIQHRTSARWEHRAWVSQLLKTSRLIMSFLSRVFMIHLLFEDIKITANIRGVTERCLPLHFVEFLHYLFRTFGLL